MSTTKKRSLGAITKTVESLAPQMPTTEVDISDILGEDKGTTVFVLRKLDVPAQYKMQYAAKEIKDRNPSFSDALALDIAGLTLAHVSPLPEPTEPTVAECYMAYVKNSQLWDRLISSFNSAFGNTYLTEEEIKHAGEA